MDYSFTSGNFNFSQLTNKDAVKEKDATRPLPNDLSYRNSVSHGRWHTSLTVSRTCVTDGIKMTDSANKTDARVVSSNFQSNQNEYGFEALKPSNAPKGKTDYVSSSTSACLAHIKDVKRLNEEYLGEDVEVLKGCMPKRNWSTAFSESSTSADRVHIDITEQTEEKVFSQSKPVFSVKKATEKTPNQLVTKEVVGTASRTVPESRYKTTMKQHDWHFQQSLVQLSQSPLDSELKVYQLKENKKTKVTQLAISALDVVWSDPKRRHQIPNQTRAPVQMIRRLSDLTSQDFVFNPKYANSLRQLPELRHIVIPANSLPVQQGNFFVGSKSTPHGN